jgi:hypothetical protein
MGRMALLRKMDFGIFAKEKKADTDKITVVFAILLLKHEPYRKIFR